MEICEYVQQMSCLTPDVCSYTTSQRVSFVHEGNLETVNVFSASGPMGRMEFADWPCESRSAELRGAALYTPGCPEQHH